MSTTVEEVVTLWLSEFSRNTVNHTYKPTLRRFCDVVQKDLREVSEADVQRFTAHLEQKAPLVSEAYIGAQLRTISSFYKRMVRARLVPHNPVNVPSRFAKAKAGLVRPTGLLAVASAEGFDFSVVLRIIDTGSAYLPDGIRNRAYLTCLFAGALRNSEALALELRDVEKTDAGTMVLTLRRTKAQHWRRQVIPNWAIPYIETLIEQRRRDGAESHAKLFVCYHKGYTRQESWGRLSASRVFRQYCRLHGFPRATPHWARATAITKLLADGIPYREVQELSRHSSVSMVEYYDKRFFGEENSPNKKLNFSR